ncbi:MAG: succinate dehydrogenase assembly factor 2 [Pseudomonadota bacterium]
MIEKALRWRCRRGMRELDQLLLGYLELRYPSADSVQQNAFIELLEAQDPVIFGYLVKGVVPESQPTADVVRAILECAGSLQVRT